MKKMIFWFIKGFGIGAANIVPGVSGGTIALITGIFERLIDSIKSFDIKAIKLLFKGKFKEFVVYTDLVFLLIVFAGAVASIFSVAKLLGFLFEEHPIYVWSFFFGLILASVFFVGKTIKYITYQVFISFLVGTTGAVLLSLLSPANENTSFIYLVLCGIAGIISMILPGLSGSFVLILMGNYQLVMITSVNNFDLSILFPVSIGVVIGLPMFSRALSWIYKKYRDQTIATLTGFILGSLSILWPWKEKVYLKDANGIEIMKTNGDPIIQNYIKIMPEMNRELLLIFAVILTGILTIWLIERLATPEEIEADNNEF